MTREEKERGPGNEVGAKQALSHSRPHSPFVSQRKGYGDENGAIGLYAQT